MNILKLIGAVLVLVVVIMAAFGRKIVNKLQEGIVKRYATKAVAMAEFMVEAAGDVKFRTALQWALVQITGKWRIPIAPETLAKWIEWAVTRMKQQGKEIKAATVLPAEHPKLQIRRDGFSVGFEKQF